MLETVSLASSNNNLSLRLLITKHVFNRYFSLKSKATMILTPSDVEAPINKME